jgi:peroxiredoxin
MKSIATIIVLVFSVLLSTAQVTPTGLNKNDQAPPFTANDQSGKSFDLKAALKKGPVVVIFYRGQWCPYCNKQLKALEDSLPMIKAKGATLVAITPESSENVEKTVEKTKATYPILFDDGLKIMKSYDVAFAVDDKTIERYKGFGIDFEKANGVNGANLPVPAVYIISKKGIIAFKHFDADYRNRLSVQEILAHL